MNTGKFCGWVYILHYTGRLYHAQEMLWNGKTYSQKQIKHYNENTNLNANFKFLKSWKICMSWFTVHPYSTLHKIECSFCCAFELPMSKWNNKLIICRTITCSRHTYNNALQCLRHGICKKCQRHFVSMTASCTRFHPWTRIWKQKFTNLSGSEHHLLYLLNAKRIGRFTMGVPGTPGSLICRNAEPQA